VTDTVTEPGSLDALRLQLAPAVAEAAVFDGWSEAAVAAAAQANGIDPAAAQFAFKGGAMDMIAAWIARIDADMVRDMPAQDLAPLPIRERIRRLIQYRLDAVAANREGLRRALVIMASPRHAARSFKLGWSSADAMWRLAGDTATDYNHYTKRLTLGGIYAATLSVFAADESAGQAETRAFLDRRIDGVMRFEKTKARLTRPRDETFSVTRLLGRLRYPAT